jgi:NhaP-type Na+/H+ or K+/H+ antiporter
MTPERLGLLWGITVFAGSGARLLAVLTGLPGVVLLLISGLLIGRAGLGLVEPLDLGVGLEVVVGLLVSLVLFDGGLNLRLPGSTIKAVVVRIVLVRLAVSLLAGVLVAHWLAGLTWPLAAVYSAIVLATGPTVVTPLVQQMRLRPPLGDVLEGEGLVLEPIGAVLALLLVERLLGDLHGWRDLALGLLLRLGGGVAAGVLAGLVLSEALRRLRPDPATGLRLQITLGILFLTFGLCEWWLPESGLPASVAAGVVVARRATTAAEQLDDVVRQLARLAITMLFPLLAADVSWAELSPLGWGGLACVLILMVGVRPLSIGLATLGLPLERNQKLLLGWLAPRGIVTAAVASLFAIRLEQEGVLGAGRLQGLVFLTILLTVGLQGLSAGPLANLLGLVEEEDSEAAADAGDGLPDPGEQTPGGEKVGSLQPSE